MTRTPFAVYRKIYLILQWYGTDYQFSREEIGEYKEPTGDVTVVQSIRGIYHSTWESFVELINVEGASVKAKINRGILCDGGAKPLVQQGDQVIVAGVLYQVTAVEPVLYNERTVAWEISLEEKVVGVN